MKAKKYYAIINKGVLCSKPEFVELVSDKKLKIDNKEYHHNTHYIIALTKEEFERILSIPDKETAWYEKEGKAPKEKFYC